MESELRELQIFKERTEIFLSGYGFIGFFQKRIALSTDKKAPTITVKGNYSGRKKVNFTIAANPFSEENGITVVAKRF